MKSLPVPSLWLIGSMFQAFVFARSFHEKECHGVFAPLYYKVTQGALDIQIGTELFELPIERGYPDA